MVKKMVQHSSPLLHKNNRFAFVVVFIQLLQQASSVISVVVVAEVNYSCCSLSRSDFPTNFIFGSGSSAYQVEGAAFEDGRTLSTYDTFAHNGRAGGGYTGDIACDEYHRYKEDVELMADTGLDAYRFSISWSRLIPDGRGPINPKGLEYYNNLINELLSKGIQPHVTLLHYEIPQALEDSYGGWLSQQMLKDFTAYVDVCFREFGDRVKHWTTLNEANFIAASSPSKTYDIGHNILLAHGLVVKLYREKYQERQQGFVGVNLYTSWYVPRADVEQDRLAARRVNTFMIGWFMNPLLSGEYPDIMKLSLKDELPSFTEQESKMMKGSFDFIGVNCYSATAVKDSPSHEKDVKNFKSLVQADLFLIQVGGAFVQGILEDFKQNYGNPPIYVHENGFKTEHNASLDDTSRVEYLNASMGSMLDALRNGSDVKGYFQWSFLDLFEPMGGYKWGYGLYYIDHLNDPDLKRIPKHSAHWYSTLLKGSCYNSSKIIQQKSRSSSRAVFDE